MPESTHSLCVHDGLREVPVFDDSPVLDAEEVDHRVLDSIAAHLARDATKLPDPMTL